MVNNLNFSLTNLIGWQEIGGINFNDFYFVLFYLFLGTCGISVSS